MYTKNRVSRTDVDAHEDDRTKMDVGENDVVDHPNGRTTRQNLRLTLSLLEAVLN